MSGVDWNDDRVLLARLAEATAEAEAVPEDFVQIGQAVMLSHDLDAELAALVYDSSQQAVGASRADVARLRSLTFASPRVTIELTFMADVMIGQVLPPGPAEVELRTSDGAVIEANADRLGLFTVTAPPVEGFFLSCRTPEGVKIVTPLISP
jgi:hypothetical protein